MIPRVGFLPPTTIPECSAPSTAIQSELTEDGFVKRYDTSSSDDGLHRRRGPVPGLLVLAGRRPAPRRPTGPRRRTLFERLLDLRNDVGLLSEEWDPKAGRQLGNTPQAFSHFPLVTSALQLHTGRGHRSDRSIPLTH